MCVLSTKYVCFWLVVGLSATKCLHIMFPPREARGTKPPKKHTIHTIMNYTEHVPPIQLCLRPALSPAPAKKSGSSTSDATSSRWRKPHSWLNNVKQPTRGRCSSKWNFWDQCSEMNERNMSKQFHDNTLKVFQSILVLNWKLKVLQFDS